MNLFSSSRRLACVLLLGAFVSPALHAQTVQTNDYIYIGFEAEDHIAKNERWVLTTPSTPTEENDPDGNHSDQASGSTYLELLPDIRVTHDDPFGPPLGYWGRGGEGPDADYEVNFPEPGRYYVHVRAYSTGTEDNGLHVGLNGQWPESGQRMQFCTASKRAWWWSSAQRDAGGNGSCGVEKSIWLDVDTAGTHTFSISAREDGFEIDRIALVKDLSGNTRVCTPVNIDGVNCQNGSIESADGFIDLRVRLESVSSDLELGPDEEAPNPTVVEQGKNVSLTALIENLDGFDTANNIVLTLSPSVGNWEMVDMDARCTADGDEFICTLDDLHPTAPNENAPFQFTLTALGTGDLRIDASVVGDEVDNTPSNDVAATVISTMGGEPVVVVFDTDVKLAMLTNKQQFETDESVQLSLIISNVGDVTADNVVFTSALPSGLSVNSASLPMECSYNDVLQCAYNSIDAAGSESVAIELIGDRASLYTLSGNVSVANELNSSNNIDSVSLLVKDPVVETTTEGSVDATAGATTGASSGTTTGDTTTGGSTAGTSDTGGGTDLIGEPVEQEPEAEAGAMAHWFLLLLLVVVSTRLYGWHQRQRVAIRK